MTEDCPSSIFQNIKKKSPLSAPQAPISYTSNVDIYTGLSRAFFMPEKRVHADSVA
jgi:hypothetical protein